MRKEKDSRIQGVEWSRKGNKGRRKMGEKRRDRDSLFVSVL